MISPVRSDWRRKADRALVRIVSLHPLETCGRRVALVERGFLAIEPVQVAHELLEPVVPVAVLDQVPIETGFVIPFVPLAEFAAHEQQLFAGLGHTGKPSSKPQVGEFLPVIAGHLSEQEDLCHGRPRRAKAAGRSSPQKAYRPLKVSQV